MHGCGSPACGPCAIRTSHRCRYLRLDLAPLTSLAAFRSGFPCSFECNWDTSRIPGTSFCSEASLPRLHLSSLKLAQSSNAGLDPAPHDHKRTQAQLLSGSF